MTDRNTTPADQRHGHDPDSLMDFAKQALANVPQTVGSAIDAHAASFPNYYVVAGDHRFGCTCANCIAFHARSGLDTMLEDPDAIVEWAALRGEPALGPVPEKCFMSDDQVSRFMALVMDHL